MSYYRPTQLHDALIWLGVHDAGIVAGCTDLFAASQSQYLDKASFDQLLDITAISELGNLETSSDDIRIGAAVKWRDIIQAKLCPAFDSLKAAAREVGSVQIQNSGTIGGNLCNASPAADGVPPLLILDARVELASTKGTRQLPLCDFLLGPRQTAIRNDEILTSIIIPRKSTNGISNFLKLGARKYLVISIAMVAVRLVIEENLISEISISVGSCSAVATRLHAVERALQNIPANADVREIITDKLIAKELSPIDDIRADRSYRLKAARELVIRSVDKLLEGAGVK